MIEDVEQQFAELLKTTELRKVDFKAGQYRIDNEHFKSEFIKDILCIANAPGNDGYILLGVKRAGGKPPVVVGISNHHDSSDMEEIVNGVIEGPIQFEYYPVKYGGKDCALIHIPPSKAKPHWPKKNYGILKMHVIYTRRASGNRLASIQEIRDMCIESIRVSDIASRKARSSKHIVDEFASYDIKERTQHMYKVLRSIAPKMALMQYRSVSYSGSSKQTCALVTSSGSKKVHHLAIIMYPWTVKRNNIRATRYDIINLTEADGPSKLRPDIKARLIESMFVHISYKTIYTKALENKPFQTLNYWVGFANEWKESWGKVMKWEPYHAQKKPEYEFFLANVTSKAELKEQLEKLLAWVDSNVV